MQLVSISIVSCRANTQWFSLGQRYQLLVLYLIFEVRRESGLFRYYVQQMHVLFDFENKEKNHL